MRALSRCSVTVRYFVTVLRTFLRRTHFPRRRLTHLRVVFLTLYAWRIFTAAPPGRCRSMSLVSPPGCRCPPMPISVPPLKFFTFPNASPSAGSLKSSPRPLPGSPWPTSVVPKELKSAHFSRGHVHVPSLPPNLRCTLKTG